MRTGSEKSTLDPRTRSLMLKVIDDCSAPALPHILYQLWNYRRCDDILRFLVSQGLTGFRLLEMVSKQFKGSPYHLAAWALGSLDKRFDGVTMYGRDWVERT